MAKAIVIKELSEARNLAQPLIFEHHTHLVDARILYLVTNQPMKRHDRVIAGKANKAAALPRFLSSFKDADVPSVMAGYDYLLLFSEQEWSLARLETKRALIDHELSHCVQREKIDRKTGEVIYSWALAAHDVEEFHGVIKRHGLDWSAELRQLGKLVGAQLAIPGLAEDRPVREAAG